MIHTLSGVQMQPPDACATCDYSFEVTFQKVFHDGDPCQYGYWDGVYRQTYDADFQVQVGADPGPELLMGEGPSGSVSWFWEAWWLVYPGDQGHDLVFHGGDGYLYTIGFWDLTGDTLHGELHTTN